jgi:hypothetical protein
VKGEAKTGISNLTIKKNNQAGLHYKRGRKRKGFLKKVD